MVRNQHSALVHVEAADSDEEEVVTVVEKEKTDSAKKIVVVTDKHRTVIKYLEVESLEDFIMQGRETLGYADEEDVYAVLEEDGTEVDEEEYFQLLADRTHLMVLSTRELWSPSLSLHGSYIFDSGSRLSSGQLAQALLKHLQKTTINLQNSAGCNMDEDDFPVEIISQSLQQVDIVSQQESTTF